MDNRPNVVEKKRTKYQFYYAINFDIEFDKQLGDWKYNTVNLPIGPLTYDAIVNAMISFKYPADKMQAIINNYLLDSDDTTAIEEFNHMQKWRKFSKDYAKEIMDKF